jgi:allophanate hydrolase subunit 1
VHLPLAFDDSQTRAAVERYAHSIRKDAPNCEGGSNVDYVVRYNGLESREALYEAALATEQWSAFIGFFPGLPFMFPLDPRDAIFVPKYNPTRTWTPEGALGIGGPCYAIYPVESAGGYQLIGRTLPVYDLQGRNAVFRQNPLLLRAGDRVRFHRVEEDELLRLFDDVHADRYEYRIEEGSFDVGAYLDWTRTVSEEADERRRQREEAAAATPVP